MNDVEKLKNAFYKVQCMNWVRNLGIGHSSAGKTLENILGKKDDYDSLPDFGSIELKTKIDGTEPFVGLISIVPDSEPLLINRLLNNYGWASKKNKKYKVFYAQVYGNKFINIGYYYSYKLYVNYRFKRIELLIKNNLTNDVDNRIAWSFEQLSLRLNKKLSLLALFNVKKFYVPVQKAYYFKYYKMSIYKFKDLNSFLKAVENGYIRMNIKIDFYDNGAYYGRIHNKGTTFEVYLDRFDEIFSILDE